jgi:cadmium resistance protein CadD (predicted permease)
VFTPLLRTLGIAGSVTAIGLFLVLIGAWCAAGALLSAHPLVTATGRRAGHLLIPLLFLVIGALILLSTGTAGWLAHRIYLA